MPVEITLEKLLGWVMPVVLSALVGSLLTKVRAMEQRDRERDATIVTQGKHLAAAR